MATFKFALLWALAATVGLAFFGLQCRSSNRLSVELVAKLAAADLRQQQLNEEVDKLLRDIRVLRHDVDDYRSRLDAKSDSLRQSEKAEEECKASLAKLELEQSRTDEAARTRADGLEQLKRTLSQQLEKAESDIKMRQADLLNLQRQMNATSLSLSRAEEKIRLLLSACQDTAAITVRNATGVTVPLPTESANNVSTTATAFVKNVTTFVTPAVAADAVVTTASAAAMKNHTTTSVTPANSGTAVTDGKSTNVTETLHTTRHVAVATNVLVSEGVAIPPDDTDADGTDADGAEADDAQLFPEDEEQRR